MKQRIAIKVFLVLSSIWDLPYSFAAEGKRLIDNPQYSDSHLKEKKNIVHIAIIGSGVAGLSALLYGGRAGFHTVLFQGEKPGGLVVDAPSIENWPGIEKMSGIHIIEKIEHQARMFSPFIVPRTVQRVNLRTWPFELTLNDNTKINALSVVIATGASYKDLGIEGEKKYLRRGILTCTTCDAPLSKGKRTIIVGGGDIAIERALQIAPYARSVTIITKAPALYAAPNVKNKIKGIRNIKVIVNKEVTKIMGDEKWVNQVELRDSTTGKRSHFATDLIFISGALQPNSELFKGQLPLDSSGSIMVQCRTQETPIPGVSAAGTVADSRYRQASIAAGDGVKAALDAMHFLRELGFDGPRREHIQKQLYQPEVSQYRPLEKISSAEALWRLLRTTPSYVLVEFYSPVCSTCKRMEPIVERLSSVYQKQFLARKVDTTQTQPLVNYYRIAALPTLILFLRGRVVGRIEGEKTRQELESFIKKYVR